MPSLVTYCEDLPKTEVMFLDPISKTNSASGGKNTKVYEYGECIGKAGYYATKNPAILNAISEG